MQSTVCSIVTFWYGPVSKPANGRPLGLMLTVCLKAGLFLLEKAATVALQKKESNIGIQLHRRDISFLNL